MEETQAPLPPGWGAGVSPLYDVISNKTYRGLQ